MEMERSDGGVTAACKDNPPPVDLRAVCYADSDKMRITKINNEQRMLKDKSKLTLVRAI